MIQNKLIVDNMGIEHSSIVEQQWVYSVLGTLLLQGWVEQSNRKLCRCSQFVNLVNACSQDNFKQVLVTPLLHKVSLNPSDVKSFRHVSLLSFLAKILGKVVLKVSGLLPQNNFLVSKQPGFKSGHSTETAFLSATEALRAAKVSVQASVLILLDFSAAFDTVNHDILLSTLSELGISGKVKCWFESYLSGCSFSVSWQGQVTTFHHLSTGVPQGSILGPLLFSI